MRLRPARLTLFYIEDTFFMAAVESSDETPPFYFRALLESASRIVA
jgi:hypothetical protein